GGARAEGEIGRVVKWVLLHVAQQERLGTPTGPAAVAPRTVGVSRAPDGVLGGGHRELVICRVVVVQGQADLLEVVDALGAASGLARRLYGGGEQGGQNRRWWGYPEQAHQGGSARTLPFPA